jgi:hypothetical protein
MTDDDVNRYLADLNTLSLKLALVPQERGILFSVG